MLVASFASVAHAALTIDLSYVDTDSSDYQRFKAWVDEAVDGHPDYGFSATDAAMMYRITGDASYATLAVATVDADVAAAEDAIADGHAPDVAAP